MKLAIGSFNVENLITRHRFGEKGGEKGVTGDASAALSLFHFPVAQERAAIERTLTVALEDDKRQMTALAIAEAEADIWCLQEVDSLASLQAFFANYVHRVSDARFGHFALRDGNDRRGIEVAFAARRDLMAPSAVRSTSHAEETFETLDVWHRDLAAMGLKPEDRVFVRDCLMVDLDFGRRRLTVFVCHFKSMSNGSDDGRAATLPLRRAEALAVTRLVKRRFGAGWREANWVIAGDFNGFRHGIGPGGGIEDEGESGVEPLLDRFAVDPLATLPAHERWTHFRRWWSETQGRLREQHMPLDGVLLSPALAVANPSPGVRIIRRGLPYRAPLDPRAPDRSIAHLATTADRYPRVGWDRPKASDHCPVVVEVTLPEA
jgi:endonuclease/exonuclease/phosphatase family metal-dependent hydrolase